LANLEENNKPEENFGTDDEVTAKRITQQQQQRFNRSPIYLVDFI